MPSIRNGLLLLGSVIGFASALGLAWNECVGHVVHEVLTARDSSGLAAIVRTLMQLGGCLLGAVVGGTIVSIGVRQAARRNGLSLACVMGMGLYGALSLFGTFAVCWGVLCLETALRNIALSGGPTTAEEMTQATISMLSLGWRLLAVAYLPLLLGSVLQCVTRPKYVTTSTQWPVITIAALIPLGLSGVLASYLWVRCGLAFQHYATGGAVKASDIVDQLNVVLFCNGAASCVLTGYALLITGLAGQAAFASRSFVAPAGETSSDPL